MLQTWTTQDLYTLNKLTKEYNVTNILSNSTKNPRQHKSNNYKKKKF
ncbi:28243_t:CDS:2 [Gigaspora margarita]|uniref:28243_t:CDS:1 n=1 Tax=Gigaspora margarita TaxID=4874 RepID=A0ABN7UUS9_GIGMA|nr:28243_t:CDS:2 [Gigaspora margarita]